MTALPPRLPAYSLEQFFGGEQLGRPRPEGRNNFKELLGLRPLWRTELDAHPGSGTLFLVGGAKYNLGFLTAP